MDGVHDPDVEHQCPTCGIRVFAEHLPGGQPQTGKLLDTCRALHAEENAILNLSRTGLSALSKAVIYTTTFLCRQCANKILKSGLIKEAVYAEPYLTAKTKELLEASEIEVRGFEGVKSSAYFRLYP